PVSRYPRGHGAVTRPARGIATPAGTAGREGSPVRRWFARQTAHGNAEPEQAIRGPVRRARRLVITRLPRRRPSATSALRRRDRRWPSAGSGVAGGPYR